ncbi:GMC oxidoreductase [Ceratobasidium sp. AG-Ba]|nr:GMC oxidoreductase [Ceratobasidium sp. AG-Ba]
MAQHPKEVDIIFVGGNSIACVAAGRLAAANPGLEILLVEQGPNNLADPTVVTPAFYLSHLAPTSKTAKFWQGNKSNALNGRAPIVPTAQILGGGSRSHYQRYTRASASDFDDWKTPGWSSAELLPLLRKASRGCGILMETYHVAPGKETHGYSGPLNVSYADTFVEPAKQYIDTVQKMGIPLAEDHQNLSTGHGCQRWAKWIDPATGHRQDAAHRYIHPLAENKSLHILTKTKVTRVLFDGTKATGVEVIGNKDQDADADQTPQTITARKLVVVSSGAIGTPVVLQRSGIGAADRLAKIGVPTVVDLPGVGATYEDHHLILYTYFIPGDYETIDPILDQDPAAMEKLLPMFMQGKGALTSNIIDAGSKLRPTPEELKEIGPEFGAVWKEYFERAPDKPVMLQALISGFLGPRDLIPKGERVMMFGNYSGYPISRGHVYATSADPYAAPDFATGFFEKQADVDIHIWAYKKAREIARRMPCYRGEFAPLHPKYPEGSAAAAVKLDKPLDATSLKNLTYTAEDDAAIEAFIRQMVETTWHSCGTVPMKPKEQSGCVDARLNVYGTQNLKVADLSIIPGNVGANTNSTAMLVGEKAAVLIAEDLGLKLE